MTPLQQQLTTELRRIEHHLRQRADVIEVDPTMRRADCCACRMAALELHYANVAIEQADWIPATTRLEAAASLLQSSQERRPLNALQRAIGIQADPIPGQAA